MKYRIIALWRLLTCKSFWLVSKSKNGKLKRVNNEIEIPDLQCIIANAEDAVFTSYQQEENLKLANKIISE